MRSKSLSKHDVRRVDDFNQDLEALRSLPDVNIQEKFQYLATTWKAETNFSSSSREMAMHPAYQQIIGLGPAAIPFILRELEEQTDHWFWALRAITGDDPVPDSARGRIEEMAKAWLEWGRKHGYRR
ncbi:MAG: hypothetical protein ABIH23_05925 [bacterium]